MSSTFNVDTKESWTKLFESVAKQRPSVGKQVCVTEGKYANKVGKVTWHGVNKFRPDYYAAPAQTALRQAMGRHGYRVRVVTPEGEAFFVDADKVTVVDEVE